MLSLVQVPALAMVAPILFWVFHFNIGRGVSTGKTWEQISNVIGIYAQDTWRVTDRLTLNLGLRYDAHTPWVETNDHQANYNFATGNIDLAGQNGASRALYNGFYGGRDFQPRIGFAWTPGDAGRAHGGPRRVHNFVVSGRHRHEPSSDTEPTFYSGRNQCHLQQRCTACHKYNGRYCGLGGGGILRCACLCLLREALSSGSGIPTCSRRSPINGT